MTATLGAVTEATADAHRREWAFVLAATVRPLRPDTSLRCWRNTRPGPRGASAAGVAARLVPVGPGAVDWDAEAATFDDEPDHGLRSPAARRAWGELLARHMPSPPARVADLGCGTGTLSVLLAEAGHDVIGVDDAPRMLEVARGKSSAAGARARFVLGDASIPPLSRGAFDVALARHVLWAMPDPRAALTAWVGLLAPHGRLLLIEGRWHTGAGLTAGEATAFVSGAREEAQVEHLTDPLLWGGPLRDERYLIVSRR